MQHAGSSESERECEESGDADAGHHHHALDKPPKRRRPRYIIKQNHFPSSLFCMKISNVFMLALKLQPMHRTRCDMFFLQFEMGYGNVRHNSLQKDTTSNLNLDREMIAFCSNWNDKTKRHQAESCKRDEKTILFTTTQAPTAAAQAHGSSFRAAERSGRLYSHGPPRPLGKTATSRQ